MTSKSPGPDHHRVARDVRADAPVIRSEWDRRSTKGERIEMVAAASAALDAAKESLDESVRLARVEGASWGEIGQVLGISRQAAFQRFGASPPDPVAP